MRSVRSRLSDPSTAPLIVSGPTVQRRAASLGRELEAELGRDHDLVSDGRERFAD